MKRFYKTVTMAARAGGFVIELDGREVKTPEKRPNISPTDKLAQAIHQEWQAQTDSVKPDSMPIAKLQNSALDRVAPRKGEVIDELIKFAGTDLLCYRAEFPGDLVEKQAQIWQPLLDWAGQRHNVTLKVTTGIIHIEQDDTELNRLRDFLCGLDSFRLMAFYTVTTLCGSVALALNLAGGNICAEQVWAAAQLDENYQTAKWGLDDEATIRQDNMKSELDAAVRFLNLL